MATIELRKSVCRILTDLVKSDNVISVDEMDVLDEAAKAYDDYSVEIIKADATTAKNYRAWNLYGDESQDMDVWVEATAKTGKGFIEVGAYLSDIWQTGAVDYTHHMYTKYYKAV